MKAELVPVNGEPPIPIDRDVTIIGRREYCDVQIDHRGLSKRHCVVVKTDGLLVIRDLVTTNGTKVNGQRIRWAALLPNDKVTLGAYKMKVYLGPDDAPSPSELMGRSLVAQPVEEPLAINGGPPVQFSPAPNGAATYAPPKLAPVEVEVEERWPSSLMPAKDGDVYIIDLD